MKGRRGWLIPPRAIVYRTAFPGPRIVLNRYPEGVIGIALSAAGRVLSIVWRRV